MIKSIAILLALQATAARAAHTFTPATGVAASVSVSITNGPAGTMRYVYRIASGNGSTQDVREIYLLVPSSFSLSIGSPTNWDGGYVSPDNVVYWSPQTIEAMRAFGPNTSLSGFSLASPGVPDISKFLVRGNAPLPSFDEGDDSEPGWPDKYEDAVQVKTIVPSSFTATDPASAIDRLISLKHQAASLSWIGNAEFVFKLDKRLDQARAALAQNKKKLAGTRLTQFIRDLTGAYGEHGHEHGDKAGVRDDKDSRHPEKFVNDEAFQLLKINAEFIISKLPTESADKDDDGGDSQDGGKSQRRDEK